MDDITFKKTAIIARQIILYFVDFHNSVLPLFDKANVYRVPLKEYWKFRENDKRKFDQELYRLKREGFINKYFDGKEYFIELSERGKNLLRRNVTEDLTISVPKKWDGKWHIVIFDVPNEKKEKRDVVRYKLKTLGFVELQESVYVFPFDCSCEVRLLKQMYIIEPYVQYIVADRIETEKDLIKIFYDLGILEDNMIKL